MNDKALIVVRADHLSEQHLAEIALAIQNRWNVPTFVKMHEVIVMDDEGVNLEERGYSRKVITTAMDPNEVERGFNVILGNLELDRAFKLERRGREKFQLKLVDPSALPKWIEKAKSDLRQPPEGVFVCPHCGKYCANELELSMHTKLHYII